MRGWLGVNLAASEGQLPRINDRKTVKNGYKIFLYAQFLHRVEGNTSERCTSF